MGYSAPSSRRDRNGEDLGEPKFHPFWAKAEQLGVPVFIHPQGSAVDHVLGTPSLSDDDKAAILGGNAVKLLGIRG